MTEAQIEYLVERRFDELDWRFTHSEMSQDEYDQAAQAINSWADGKFERLFRYYRE